MPPKYNAIGGNGVFEDDVIGGDEEGKGVGGEVTIIVNEDGWWRSYERFTSSNKKYQIQLIM